MYDDDCVRIPRENLTFQKIGDTKVICYGDEETLEKTKIIKVYNNLGSGVFKLLSEIASAKHAEIRFIYKHYKGPAPETSSNQDYNTIISQILEGKCIYIPEVDLILHNNGDKKIDCFSGEQTFKKLKDFSENTLKHSIILNLSALESPIESLPLEPSEPTRGEVNFNPLVYGPTMMGDVMEVRDVVD